MRFLLVVPPLAGHVAPLRGVAAELTARGHAVAWCGAEPGVSRLVGAGPAVAAVPAVQAVPAVPAGPGRPGSPPEPAAPVWAAGDSAPFEVGLRPPGLRGFAALKHLWEQYLVPLAEAMVPGVAQAVAEFGPDVVVADQQAFAGALVAARTGVPWATSASTSAELGDPLAVLPKIASWADGLQDGLRRRHGVESGDLRFSPRLVLAFTTRALAGPPAAKAGPAVRYVGPVPAAAPPWPFPWSRLDGRPLVLVTLGTANAPAGRRFLRESAVALSALPGVQGLVVDPGGTVAVEGILTRARIPQTEVLRNAAAVVCHGGHNTVCETLSAGLPLVVAPIRDDQSILAGQVVDAGAGLRLRFDRATAADLAVAVRTVLDRPRYRAAARGIAESFRAAGGAGPAADRLEALGGR
ncbi:nucleotide disphospho-sugar-binding domain-containing protein [Amycolatopsis sp. PS_44_ISF1]|uniref:glycosyltransferase n=1 Tax=Amycolatopsis sp. PS_44_ISF1 TaxID=2974917 RepID=UPI0028E03FCC|nr:nucleotide disphospho-sugar-binding domain-containing protein [Amycolatopsis sp. PS_44_ISF1]MDT8912978.1 glycosyltransferase [Amycolatopsis sp. PS_44_ISF1]